MKLIIVCVVVLASHLDLCCSVNLRIPFCISLYLGSRLGLKYKTNYCLQPDLEVLKSGFSLFESSFPKSRISVQWR